MKSEIKLLAMLFVLCFMEFRVEAQIGGCDLCGPATSSGKNIASGSCSATIGAGCESRGSYSFAVGYFAKSYMTNTIAMGKFVRAQATNAMVIGTGSSNVESGMLVNSVPNSLMVGFNSSFPTLSVTSSSGNNTTGKVGIGNVVPKTKLHVRSDSSEDAGIILEPSNLSKSAFVQLYNENNRIIVNPDSGLSVVSRNGTINFDANNVMMNAKVAINTPKSFTEGYDHALAVAGGILTTKVLVKEVDDWYDYVFDADYDLIPIEGLQQYIDDNGHLPDMPSERDVLSEGYDMVEMDGLLLKKIEELTLYTIELNELISRQQEIIDSLKSE